MNEKEVVKATSLKLPTGSIAVFVADCIVAVIAAFLWYAGYRVSWLHTLMAPIVLLPLVSLCFIIFRHYGLGLLSNCFHVLCILAIAYGFWVIFNNPLPESPPSDEGLTIIFNVAGRAVLVVFFSIMEVMLFIITLFTIPITFSAIIVQKTQVTESITKDI